MLQYMLMVSEMIKHASIMQGAFPGPLHNNFEYIKFGKIMIPIIQTKIHNWIFSDLKSSFASKLPLY